MSGCVPIPDYTRFSSVRVWGSYAAILVAASRTGLVQVGDGCRFTGGGVPRFPSHLAAQNARRIERGL